MNDTISSTSQTCDRGLATYPNIDIMNHCDFCGKRYCDECIPDTLSFQNCDKCHRCWCYISTNYWDGYCESNTRVHASCQECGN